MKYDSKTGKEMTGGRIASKYLSGYALKFAGVVTIAGTALKASTFAEIGDVPASYLTGVGLGLCSYFIGDQISKGLVRDLHHEQVEKLEKMLERKGGLERKVREGKE